MAQQEEPSEQQYVGRVLPGSRWLQRAFQGHVDQEVTVLRVGARSVMLVIEGFIGPNGGRGATHDRKKVGMKFNVVLETFLRTHTLLSQPKGYKPGDELDPTPAPAAPKVDAVETFFKRRQFAADWLANLEGKDIRVAATDPDFPVLTGPQRYTGDVVIPTPPKEEPMQPVQVELAEPPEDIVPTKEMGYNEEQLVEMLAPPDPPAEPDPLEVFLAGGHAQVAKLTAELDAVGKERDEYRELADLTERKWQSIKAKRDRIENAVLAAIASAEGQTEQPPDLQEVVKRGPEVTATGQSLAMHDTVAEIIVRPGSGGTTRLAGPLGYVPRPGKVSQRQWVLDRFVKEGRLVIQEVVDDFCIYFGAQREAAIKNISSVMHHQIKHPAVQWPVPVRQYAGTYVLHTQI